jgi:hypothetical protein
MSSVNHTLKILSLFATSLVLSACDTTSTTLWETPNIKERTEGSLPDAPVIENKIFGRADGQARGEGLKYDPRVDILFVIDNSDSMSVHQANLQRNINKFVNALGQTKAIDFQIGVTATYDSIRYGSIVQKTCDGKVNYLENGELSPLKGVADSPVERFVTRRDGYLKVLEQTLNIGIAPFVSESAPGCKTGPENEEIFSPIIQSFSDLNQSGPNIGFWREGSLKVVMLVTDAYDSSPELTPSLVYDQLYRLSGSTPDDQKFRIYAVTAIPGQSVNPSTGMIGESRTCRLDFGFKQGSFPSEVPNHNVAQLVKRAGGRLLSICNSDYGSELARVGEEIRVATLKDIVYNLPHLPDRTPGRDLQVRFIRGDGVTEVLTEGNHWVYDSQKNRVVVKGINLDWDKYPDAYIDVDYFIYDPADPNNQIIK